jgi:hypothetical protein
MARKQFSPQDLQEIQALAARWGKIIAKRAFGEQGPGLEADLSALEAVATAAARGLTEGTLTALLQQQAQTLGNQQACPACGTLCPVCWEERPLHVQGGHTIPLNEPLCHCPGCRRDFFPPAACLASGRTQL